MLLTAAHVIGGLFPFSASEIEVMGYGEVSSPDGHDTTTSADGAISFTLGYLRRSIPPSPSQECTIDAAIAEVTSRRELKNHLEGKRSLECETFEIWWVSSYQSGCLVHTAICGEAP